MSKKAAVPDAWDDDDWNTKADQEDAAAAAAEAANSADHVKLTKAQRLAQHAEANKKIWQTAEEPEVPYFLVAREAQAPPLKQEFKPALRVLSRKPTPSMVQKVDPVTGLAKMTMEDDEEEEVRQDQPTQEELKARAEKARQEKQKKYDEARARIFVTGSGRSTPGIVTSPTEEARSIRGKGRGRGNGRQENSRPQSQSGSKELFDPNSVAKSGTQKRNGETRRSGTSTPKDEDQVIRAPRGPDSSGRGFGNRGGRMG
ncbi:hypothetical protein ONS95_004973 [Cadophora gregata]|uniref:uncharacterized protein n=1 Tax=Cadophora gregata TaxID=51156 RepID=UPI0026DB1779|nr:uncharacterized protein ONS95_004973 [Cadophora gregata]KAK0104701.1 hypothetical protein ONS95_004973 [Cadophora gregata]KAK0115216.1 hypothetical protein ONS96_013682 [Cadophora gregata f. sp. sojae]